MYGRVLLLLSFLIGVNILNAQEGAPDPGFNGDGFHVFEGSSFESEINDMVELPDGSVIHVGYTRVESGTLKIQLGKKLVAGTPDNAFGVNGYSYADFGYEAQSANINGEYIALLAGGKFIVAGQLVRGGDNPDMIYMARFNADGSPDLTFSDDGIAEHELGGEDIPRITNVSFQVDGQGRYLFSTTIYVQTGATNHNLSRYTADGERDMQFGTAGMTTRTIDGANGRSFDFVLRQDGSILTQATSAPDNFNYVILLFKNGADGETVPDDVISFSTPLGTLNSTGIAISPTGKIALSGTAKSADSTFYSGMVMQLTSNLGPDITFGVNAIKLFRINGENDVEMPHIRYSADGSKIIVAGSCRFDYGGGGGKGGGNDGNDWVLARLLSTNGDFDTNFGTGGFTHKDFGFNEDNINQMVLLQNGKILLAGTVDTEDNSVGAIGRFTGVGSVSVNDVAIDGGARLINTVTSGDLYFYSLQTATTSINVTDVSGRICHTAKINLNSGITTFSVPANLSTGIYFISGAGISSKFLLQRQ